MNTWSEFFGNELYLKGLNAVFLYSTWKKQKNKQTWKETI